MAEQEPTQSTTNRESNAPSASQAPAVDAIVRPVRTYKEDVAEALRRQGKAPAPIQTPAPKTEPPKRGKQSPDIARREKEAQKDTERLRREKEELEQKRKEEQERLTEEVQARYLREAEKIRKQQEEARVKRAEAAAHEREGQSIKAIQERNQLAGEVERLRKENEEIAKHRREEQEKEKARERQVAQAREKLALARETEEAKKKEAEMLERKREEALLHTRKEEPQPPAPQEHIDVIPENVPTKTPATPMPSTPPPDTQIPAQPMPQAEKQKMPPMGKSADLTAAPADDLYREPLSQPETPSPSSTTPEIEAAIARVRARGGSIPNLDKHRLVQKEQREAQQPPRVESHISQHPRAPQSVRVTSEPKRFNWTVLIVIVLLFASGGGILYAAYSFFFTEKPTQPVLAINTLILAEGKETIDVDGLSGRALLNTLAEEKNALTLTPSAITYFELTIDVPLNESAAILPADLLMKRLGEHAPSALARSVNNTYMLGIHGSADKQPFLILKPTFYENAFAGMLDWEMYMAEDLAPFFTTGIENGFIIFENAENSAPRRSWFEDKVIENHDTRVLYNKRGEIALLYSFLDRETLIITTNTNTFLEIIHRLEAKRLSR